MLTSEQIKLAISKAKQGDKFTFTYDGKPRAIVVEKIGESHVCGNCSISGGFRNFRFEKIENLA